MLFIFFTSDISSSVPQSKKFFFGGAQQLKAIAQTVNGTLLSYFLSAKLLTKYLLLRIPGLKF